MKELPILMSTPMVKAIIEGRKTMTRRIVNPQPDPKVTLFTFDEKTWPKKPWIAKYELDDPLTRYEITNSYTCPYGKPGDILYVRETHFRYGKWIKNGKTKTGKQAWKFRPDKQFDEVLFMDSPPAVVQKGTRSIGYYKRPGIFLPQLRSRILLKVSLIKVERIQDISELDAIAEGVEPNCSGNIDLCPSTHCKANGCQAKGEYFHYTRDVDDFPAGDSKESYQSLWEKINGKESWNANPWVWVVEFKVLSTMGISGVKLQHSEKAI